MKRKRGRRRSRRRRIKPKLPIVLATGYAELPSSAVISFQRLAKPFTQKQLAEALEAALKVIRD